MFTAIAISLFLGLGLVMALIHAEAIKENINKMVDSLINLFSQKGIAELAREFSFANKAPKKCWKCDEGEYAFRVACFNAADMNDMFNDRLHEQAEGCLGCIEKKKLDDAYTEWQEAECQKWQEEEQAKWEARMIDEDPSHGCLP